MLTKKIFLKILIISFIISIFFSYIIGFIANKYDYEHTFKISYFNEIPYDIIKKENIEEIVHRVAKKSNYEVLIDSLNVLEIENFNIMLSTFYRHDSLRADSIIKKYFTEIFYEKHRSSLENYNPDLLFRFYNFGNNLLIASKGDQRNFKLKKRIGNFWLDKVSEKLTEELRKDESLHYNFKFKFLTTSLAQQNRYSSTKDGNFKKIIEYISEKKWAYLYKRLIGSTSIIFKLSLITIITFFVFTYIYLIFNFFKKTK
jgi:hypothetical protein